MDVHSNAVAEVAAIEDPVERAARAHALVTRLAEVSSEASRVRREAVEALTRDKWSNTEIGARLGLTRSRVSQLLRSGPSPERALFSHDGGPVTVAMGSQPKHAEDGGLRHTTSIEANTAWEVLRDALSGYGVACTQEIVPPDGFIDLNRPGLIALGSPKVLPMVGQMAAGDPNLVFDSDEQGRFIVERKTGTKHRSPEDQGGQADYGYLGRLPRPDGRGTFLWVAGIHAAGTQGAVRYLVDNAAELYSEVKKDKLFSLLVTANHDRDAYLARDATALTKVFLR